ncbi:MAG: ABC transporter permease [Candidatus Bipolaricaulia bacterium]
MGSYGRYLSQRFIIFIVSIFISITVVFFVPRLVPGDPMSGVLAKLGEMGGVRGAQELVDAYREIFGFDKSLGIQYLSYLRELARGNLGVSIAMFPVPVSEVLMRALPWTIGLLTVTTIISWILGTFIGAVVGWRGEESKLSKALVPAALILYSIPYYILAIILVFLFAFLWQIFPLSGGHSLQIEFSVEFIGDLLWHATLPALSIVLVSLGWWFLSMRSMIIPLRGEDYITLAKAKGLKPRRILWKYGFRNALLPQVTGLAIAFGHIVGGAIITEVIFAYPGLGWRLYESITGLDFPVIQGAVLLIILAVATANFIVDAIYPLIDPRIRYGRK